MTELVRNLISVPILFAAVVLGERLGDIVGGWKIKRLYEQKTAY